MQIIDVRRAYWIECSDFSYCIDSDSAEIDVFQIAVGGGGTVFT